MRWTWILISSSQEDVTLHDCPHYHLDHHCPQAGDCWRCSWTDIKSTFEPLSVSPRVVSKSWFTLLASQKRKQLSNYKLDIWMTPWTKCSQEWLPLILTHSHPIELWQIHSDDETGETGPRLGWSELYIWHVSCDKIWCNSAVIVMNRMNEKLQIHWGF